MNLIQKVESIKNKISSKISFNENLSKFSWFNLGGAAKVVFRPENLKELSFFLKEIKDFNTIKVLGAGSNTLIRDGGFNGVIIKFGKSFSHISLFDSNTIIAGTSVLDKNISKFRSASGVVVGSLNSKIITNSIKKNHNPVIKLNRMIKKLKKEII